MAGFFDTLFGGGAEKEAADKNIALANQFKTDALGYLQSGYDTSVGDINKAIDAYSPLQALSKQYQGGTNLYLDALGINGPEGNARAQQAFQTTPGYTQSLNAGLDAINRRRGIGGMYYSGNADQDTLNFAQGLLYNNQYAPWMQGLSGINTNNINTTGAVAQGQATGYKNLSDLAQALAQGQTSVGSNVTSQLTAANNQIAAGEAAGAKNIMSAVTAVGQMAMGMPPTALAGMGGGGGGGGGYGYPAPQQFSWGNTPIGQAFSGMGSALNNLNLGSMFGVGGFGVGS